MKQPFINVEEKIDRFVGRRTKTPDALSVKTSNKADAIPFASPRLLWRMKAVTHREKDAGDLVFLRHWFAERGEQPLKLS